MSFLLIICDELQEWERPTFHEMRGQQALMVTSRIQRFTPNDIDILTIFEPEPHLSTDADYKDYYTIAATKIIFFTRHLHKILRSALDVPNRTLCFTWVIQVKGRGSREVQCEFRLTPDRLTIEPVLNDARWLYQTKAEEKLRDFLSGEA